MGKKNPFPSKSSIRKSLLESEFDPRAKTPYSIVVGLGDPSYGETRAIELITEAKLVAKSIPSTEEAGIADGERLRMEYQEKIAQAISLLALCRVQRNGSAKDQVP